MFGYLNETGSATTIPIGLKNAFLPLPINRGQPTVFQPGRQMGVFSVGFTQNQVLVWTLKFQGDRDFSAVASKDSPALRPPRRHRQLPRHAGIAD